MKVTWILTTVDKVNAFVLMSETLVASRSIGGSGNLKLSTATSNPTVKAETLHSHVALLNLTAFA